MPKKFSSRVLGFAEVMETGHNRRRRRAAPTGDVRAILEAWLRTGPADVSGLAADLTMLMGNSDWSPLVIEATRLVDEATSAGWADHRLVEALGQALEADARGELDELPTELAAFASEGVRRAAIAQ
jgi:hypothetical protein